MLQLIGFDGDDTLWHSEDYYRAANEAFAAILGRYVDLGDAAVHASMLATERRNLKLFGYGAKGMTLSMVETAIALTEARISAADIAEYVYAEVAKGSFMILPHEQGRMAWALKQKNPQLLYDEMANMAGKMRSKTQPG